MTATTLVNPGTEQVRPVIYPSVFRRVLMLFVPAFGRELRTQRTIIENATNPFHQGLRWIQKLATRLESELPRLDVKDADLSKICRLNNIIRTFFDTLINEKLVKPFPINGFEIVYTHGVSYWNEGILLTDIPDQDFDRLSKTMLFVAMTALYEFNEDNLIESAQHRRDEVLTIPVQFFRDTLQALLSHPAADEISDTVRDLTIFTMNYLHRRLVLGAGGILVSDFEYGSPDPKFTR